MQKNTCTKRPLIHSTKTSAIKLNSAEKNCRNKIFFPWLFLLSVVLTFLD